MKKLNLIALLGILVLAASCKKDDEPEDPIIPNEEEVITTLIYTLTPDDGGDDVVFKFKDLDGDGGEDPELTEGILEANTSYNGALVLLNEQEDPAEDITEEIEEEDEEHQFFFQSTLVNASIAYNDVDENNNPVGLASSFTTGDAESGSLTIILRHEPDKDGTGVSEGDIENAGGETDIEISFDVEVQ